jgi:predicted nucleotidyltransferase
MTLEERIAAAAQILIGYGAKEVYLFGSAARGRMHAHSDVDLAVAGLEPRLYFRAYADAYEAVSMPLDLVDMDEDSPIAGYLRELRDQGALHRVA